MRSRRVKTELLSRIPSGPLETPTAYWAAKALAEEMKQVRHLDHGELEQLEMLMAELNAYEQKMAVITDMMQMRRWA